MTDPAAPRNRRPEIIAHRGASGHAPEHTWAAYELAVEMGADFLEPDLQMTRDGHLVAFHDDTLDRTARPGDPRLGLTGPATGPVRDLTLAELRRFDVGRWFNEAHPDRARPEFEGQRVVTLAELFERWGPRVRWYPETKNPQVAPGMEEALLELLDRFDLRYPAVHHGQVLIQSFSPESLRHLQTLDPELHLVQLVGPDPIDATDAALAEISRYAAGVGPHRDLVDGAFMWAARVHGLFVHPWTVDDPDEMDRMIELDVDGIFTNFPDRLRDRIPPPPPLPPR